MGHVEKWSAAAGRLGVELRGPLTVTLPDGRELEAHMLVPHFGTDKGTLVFSDGLADYRGLIALGYAYSVFDATGQASSVEDLVEVLSDWSWCGAEHDRPGWLRS